MTPLPPPGPEGPRLQKVLAQAGLASRRVCEEMIADGRVTVDGEVAVLGRRVDPEHDQIAVDGVPVSVRAGLVYYLLNKPAGVVSTVSDPDGRPTVVSLVPTEPRVHPVGRLDADSEGLLLLTNDGDLTFRLTHPRFGVEKEYLVAVEGSPRPGALRRLREGVDLNDGRTAPARVSGAGAGALSISIHEGRNRQVRRMCAAVGHPVTRLVRVRIGTVADRSLAPGEWRELTFSEVRSLETAAGAASKLEPAAAGPDPTEGPTDTASGPTDTTSQTVDTGSQPSATGPTAPDLLADPGPAAPPACDPAPAPDRREASPPSVDA